VKRLAGAVLVYVLGIVSLLAAGWVYQHRAFFFRHDDVDEA